MLTIREPIKAWHCTWGRLGRRRALLSEKVLRGRVHVRERWMPWEPDVFQRW